MDVDGPSWPALNDPSAEEFRVVRPGRLFAEVMRHQAGMSVVLLVLFWCIATVFVKNWVIGFLVAGAVIALTNYLKYRRGLKNGLFGSVVRMSPAGVEMWHGESEHIWLRWSDIDRIDKVPIETSGRVRFGGLRGMRSSPLVPLGLIGRGEREVPSIRGRMARPAHVPRPGWAADVAVPLGAVDPDWLSTSMGSWVRRYRSDLFAADDTA